MKMTTLFVLLSLLLSSINCTPNIPLLSSVIDNNAPVYARRSALPSDFPKITLNVRAKHTADGFIFLSAVSWPPVDTRVTYLIIMDNQGEVIWYKRIAYPNKPAALGYDFKVQPKGTLAYFDRRQGKHFELNNHYNQIG